MTQRLLKFGAVGIAALIVHFLVVIIITPLGIPPLVANIVAFVIAFQISYWGHSRWTFQVEKNKQNLSRFIAVSLASFCLNELLFFQLLHYTSLPYQVALFIVLGMVAGITFTLSQQWAFKLTHSNS